MARPRPSGGSARASVGRHVALRRWAPVAGLALALAAAFAFGLDDYLSFDILRTHRMAFADFVGAHWALAVLCFIGLYSGATALSFPGATFLTLAGGFLFGSALGCLWAVVGATLGAVAVFLAARSAVGGALRARAGPFLQRMEDGFKENALSYMLFLRLVPIFPFFVVNLVPAFLGVSLRDYAVATFIGIVPGAFVYASVGAGLGSYFEANEQPSLSGALTPEILAAIAGMALLSLLPIAVKRIRRR